MRVSMKWLREYIDISLGAEELAEVLTKGGIEVEGVEYLNKGFKDVYIGEVKETKPHPQADNLQICSIHTGSQVLTLVSGASNILPGDKVPVAVSGTVLPGGKVIEPAEFRGVQSQGMLCSDKELEIEGVGLDRSKGGILILSSEAPVGMKLEDYLGLDDWVLELELYPNRPDCLAMVNVAREVGTLLGIKPKVSKWADGEVPTWRQAEQKIDIDNPALSLRYAALLVDGVKIMPSPLWMQNKLRAAGVRPINNIVDITNYCMLEMGQPLHAFDRDKLTGTVRVRLAKENEQIVTLDGMERKLDSDTLVIADDNGPVAIAGVMGGLDSEVTKSTKRILFESAHFLGSSVRRTSRRLGLRSEASNRFEKGVNPHWVVSTLGMVAGLLEELGAGHPVSFAEKVLNLPEAVAIEVKLAKVNKILGTDYTEQEVRKVFDDLGFSYSEKTSGVLVVDIPSYRQDLKIEEDLLEEIARIIGYDRIPTTLAQGSQTQGSRTPEQAFRMKLRRLLIGVGMNEILSYSFVKKETDEIWGTKGKGIALLNPLREELGTMRTSLLPGILEIAARNTSRRNIDLLLFEIGNVYLPKELPLRGLPYEISKIAGITQGGSKRHWHIAQQKYDFTHVKGILTELAKESGVELEYRRVMDKKYNELLHPGRSAEIFLNDEYLGFMGELFPQLDEELGLQRPVVFELDFALLFKHSSLDIVAKSYPRFPAIQRDLAVVVPEEIPAEGIKKRVYELGGDLLKEVEIFDVYQGESIPAGHKSLALTMRYQSVERTLKDEEVNTFNSNILLGIQQEFKAEWRK